jgi:hypothetical protein
MRQQVYFGVNGALLILVLVVIGHPAVNGCERVHRSIEAADEHSELEKQTTTTPPQLKRSTSNPLDRSRDPRVMTLSSDKNPP